MKRPFYAMSSPETLARDEAALIELGPHVADEFAFSTHHLGEPKGDTEVAVIRRAEQAQEAAVKAKAEQEAARLPAVAPRVALTEPEGRALLRVLNRAYMDSLGFDRRSCPEVLDQVVRELSDRFGESWGDAAYQTNKQREAHVQQAVDRYQQRLKAARTRRDRQARGGEQRER